MSGGVPTRKSPLSLYTRGSLLRHATSTECYWCPATAEGNSSQEPEAPPPRAEPDRLIDLVHHVKHRCAPRPAVGNVEVVSSDWLRLTALQRACLPTPGRSTSAKLCPGSDIISLMPSSHACKSSELSRQSASADIHHAPILYMSSSSSAWTLHRCLIQLQILSARYAGILRALHLC